MLHTLRRYGARTWGRAGKYAKEHPYISSGTSTSVSLFVTDVVAQKLTLDPTEPWDARRSFSMFMWGLVWYGGPQQFYWTQLYPRLIGRGSNLQAAATAFADCVVNSSVTYIPSFYILTGMLKGNTLEQSLELLRKEYLTACLGMTGFWLPMQTLNFRFVPVHCQTFIVQIGNFANKIWLSWLSNRSRVEEQRKLKADGSNFMPKEDLYHRPVQVIHEPHSI